MRDEKEDVDEEGQEGDQQGGEEKDQQAEEIPGGVGGGVKMGGGGEGQADQITESGDGVDDEEGRQGVPRTRRQIEVAITGGAKKAI